MVHDVRVVLCASVEHLSRSKGLKYEVLEVKIPALSLQRRRDKDGAPGVKGSS